MSNEEPNEMEQEGDFEEVEEEEVTVRSGIQVALMSDGSIQHRLFGSSQNLVELEGLAEYIKREIDQKYQKIHIQRERERLQQFHQQQAEQQPADDHS